MSQPASCHRSTQLDLLHGNTTEARKRASGNPGSEQGGVRNCPRTRSSIATKRSLFSFHHRGLEPGKLGEGVLDDVRWVPSIHNRLQNHTYRDASSGTNIVTTQAIGPGHRYYYSCRSLSRLGSGVLVTVTDCEIVFIGGASLIEKSASRS